MSTSTSHPSSISGGCLCGQIRYTIHFPTDATWPPPDRGTCQCTKCRKFTGSLLYYFLEIPTSAVTPPITSNASFKTYSSSQGAFRGFCVNCGSSLIFGRVDTPDITEIMLGTLDEEILCGERVEGAAGEDVPVKRKGGWPELAQAARHVFYENAVRGVTDNLIGKKFWDGGSADGPSFE